MTLAEERQIIAGYNAGNSGGNLSNTYETVSRDPATWTQDDYAPMTLGEKFDMMSGGRYNAARSTQGGVTSSAPAGASSGGSGYSGLQNYPGMAQLEAMAQGQVAPGTINLLQQQAAERGISTGLPGSQVNNAAYLQALGRTSEDEIMKAQVMMSPLYQQQVSEAGQTSRLGMSLSAQMEQLQVSESGQDRRQQAQIAGQQATAALEQAGLDRRQAADISSSMEKLILSESGQDRRQAAEIAGAMDRLQVGNASQRDLALLQAQTQFSLQNLSGSQAYQREQLQSATSLAGQAMGNTASMQRLQAEMGGQSAMQTERLAASSDEAALDRILKKYITDEEIQQRYASIYQQPSYGGGRQSTTPTSSQAGSAGVGAYAGAINDYFNRRNQGVAGGTSKSGYFANVVEPDDEGGYVYSYGGGSGPGYGGVSQASQQSGGAWEYDRSTGMYYNPDQGVYFDQNSGTYYNAFTGEEY